MRFTTLVVYAALASATPLAAQPVDGYVSLLVDHVPDRDATELRTRLFADTTIRPNDRWTLRLAGFVDGLVADRLTIEKDARIRPQEAYGEYATEAFDVRAGFSRIVWGRLDELQPGDVVNPIDVARFFLEGRSEARLAVPLVRARAFFGPSTLEGVVVPVFRSGRFDELDERTSPFNIGVNARTPICVGPAPCPQIRQLRHEPDVAWRNVQGGLRFSSTSGRVDWALTWFNGFEPFGLYRTNASPLSATTPPGLPFNLVVDELFPRFSMLAGDFETVRGEWAVRGEVAAFLDDNFQDFVRGGVEEGTSVDGGVAVERRAGNYRLSGNVIMHWQSSPYETFTSGGETDVTLVVAADRSFARETRNVRVFGVYTPDERNLFLRTIASVSLRDNLSLEGSVGWFAGEGSDAIGRFSERDFVYGRLKLHF